MNKPNTNVTLWFDMAESVPFRLGMVMFVYLTFVATFAGGAAFVGFAELEGAAIALLLCLLNEAFWYTRYITGEKEMRKLYATSTKMNADWGRIYFTLSPEVQQHISRELCINHPGPERQKQLENALRVLAGLKE